jgi:hypothetical protein
VKWLLLPACVGVLYVGYRLRTRWLAREREQIDAAIAQQRQGLYYTYQGHDESLDVTARLRRDIADRKRRQAAAVTSGGTSADVREIARRA